MSFFKKVLAIMGAGVVLAAAIPTLADASRAFQQVIVANDETQPVPVTGDVEVTNLPTNQDVTVGNFPAVQDVSVTNLPAVQDVAITGGTVDAQVTGEVLALEPTAIPVVEVTHIPAGEVRGDVGIGGSRDLVITRFVLIREGGTGAEIVTVGDSFTREPACQGRLWGGHNRGEVVVPADSTVEIELSRPWIIRSSTRPISLPEAGAMACFGVARPGARTGDMWVQIVGHSQASGG